MFLCFYVLISYTIECEVCKSITNIVEDQILITNSSLYAIEEIVKFICDVSLKNSTEKLYCNEILGNITQIQKWVIQGLNTSQICHNIHMCQ